MLPDPEKKRGRPRTAEPGSTLTVWLPTRQHDRIVQLAAQRGDSVSATARQLLLTKVQQLEKIR